MLSAPAARARSHNRINASLSGPSALKSPPGCGGGPGGSGGGGVAGAEQEGAANEDVVADQHEEARVAAEFVA